MGLGPADLMCGVEDSCAESGLWDTQLLFPHDGHLVKTIQATSFLGSLLGSQTLAAQRPQRLLPEVLRMP